MSISSKDRSRLKDKLRDNLQKSKIKVKKASKEDIKEELKIGLKRESEDKKSKDLQYYIRNIKNNINWYDFIFINVLNIYIILLITIFIGQEISNNRLYSEIK